MIAMPPDAPLAFHGHDFLVLQDGALFWPARRALILADLHFEKASWFARNGQMLPPYDSRATMAAIESLVARYDPAEIWCLGDSFHDDDGPARLDPMVSASIATIAHGRQWTWITGNHDASPAAHCAGDVIAEAVLDGIVLRHEARADERRPELSGHYHPKWRVRLRGRSVARRCFVRGANRLILPALGALTGGLDARHPAILALAGPTGEAIIALNGRALHFALDRCPSVRNETVTI